MIPRKICPFPLDNLGPAAPPCIQSWMLLASNSSEIKDSCIGGQFAKATHHA
jgi:hypothetical protein